MIRLLAMTSLALLAAACGEPEDRLSDADAAAEQQAAGLDPEDGPSEPVTAPDDLPAPEDSGQVLYKAVGNEPGWSLTVRPARMDYLGDYGEVKIAEATPPDFRAAQGVYRSGKLKVTISAGPCSDGMSDLTYRQAVQVVADGRTVSGCGGGTIAPNALAGTSWTVAVNGRAPPAGTDAFLRFGDGSLSARFGCNSISGPYSLNGDHLQAGPLTQTEMACAEPAMTLEREGSRVLRSNLRVERIGGQRLRLVSEAGTIDLKRAI